MKADSKINQVLTVYGEHRQGFSEETLKRAQDYLSNVGEKKQK